MSPAQSDSDSDPRMGRVQWVNPQRARVATKRDKNQQVKTNYSQTSSTTHHIYSRQNANYNHSSQSQRSHLDRGQLNPSANTPQSRAIDEAVCRTICVIVQEYLKELQVRQQSINSARANIRDSHGQLAQTATASSLNENSCFISPNDTSRLRVRDEQTKAVETIKQLTYYLRELTNLNKQTDKLAEEDAASEQVINKLSDARNSIIQALNDFVLSNGDIDIPLGDPDDPTDIGREYDLLMEARLPFYKRDGLSNSVSSPNDFAADVVKLATRNRPPLGTIISKNCASLSSSNEIIESGGLQLQQELKDPTDEAKFCELNQRKREIQKLEKDTIELRRLFADFYNLVKVQSESVDSIEGNIIAASTRVREVNHHLAASAAFALRSLDIIMPVTGCITGALIGGPIGLYVGGKVGGITIVCATSLLGLLSSIGARKCIKQKNE